MLLGFNVFGDSVLNNVLPSKQVYTKSYYYGESVLDGIHVQNYEIDDATILAVNSEETFDIDYTIYLANFNDNLQAGSIITDLSIPLNQIVIRRKEVGDSLNPVLEIIDYDPDVFTYTDYYPRNNKNYTYTVSPSYEDVTERIEAQGIEGSGFVAFFGWTLTSIEAVPTEYKFDLEVNSGNIETVNDMKIYENYTKFPVFRFGEMEYRKGSLNTIPYNYNESTLEYEIDVDVLDNLKAFINNKEEKILRNSAGENFKVITTNFSHKYLDKTSEQIYSISFDFIETGIA